MDHAAHAAHARHASSDTAFAVLQARGRLAMGVDQYTSTHHFTSLADGGIIRLERDTADGAGVATIRAHLREIARAFAAGDFSTPAFVHLRDAPGTRTMADRRAHLRYDFHPVPRGGEVRITTTDSTALHAVHEFLAFQRQDHRAGQ
ncbi:MAG TPA: hypothetical protein VFY16_02710 [Gemmatimonadaceae bacterium]|nr:hypothetical protein [Gemmatimonadaceae bacterium]